MDRSLVLVGLVSLFLLVDVLALAAPTTDPGYLPIPHARADQDRVVVVQKGDHFWKISRRQLEAATGVEPADSEVSPYWRQTIKQNIHSLRSGDPDLIYPGEQLVMPPLP